jgi:hypothetical protein
LNYQIELLLDPEFTPEIRKVAAVRLKRVTEGAVELSFKEYMHFAITVG